MHIWVDAYIDAYLYVYIHTYILLHIQEEGERERERERARDRQPQTNYVELRHAQTIRTGGEPDSARGEVASRPTRSGTPCSTLQSGAWAP